MIDDQGLLFAGLGGEAVEDDVAERQMRLCALNVNSPSATRAHGLVDWLLASGSNVLVLTELQPSEGGILIMNSLEADGYTVTRTNGWRDGRYLAAVATKGFQVSTVDPAPFDPRVVAVNLTSHGGSLRMVGVYAPTNGMTAESSTRRRAFQQRMLVYLAQIRTPGLCVAGDLNVVEPGHQPPLPAFEEHDYDFYRGLVALGLPDAYRTCHPHCTTSHDHSWLSPRFGSQRLDHLFVDPHAGHLTSCTYDHGPREQKLTDHAALMAVLDLPACGARPHLAADDDA